jgi:hypothetical protein
MDTRGVVVVTRLFLLAIACEALVQLWFHAAPLQGVRQWIIRSTPFLISKRQDTHLMDCKYCVSVWAGAFLMVAYFYMDYPAVMYFIGLLIIHRLSNFLHLVFSWIRDKQYDIRVNRGRRE